MVYLPTNLSIKISHSWIGKYTIFPWILWVSVELWVNPLSWVYSMDNFKPMVWLKELQLVSGMNRTKSTQSRKVWSTFHAQRLSINREPISCTSLFKQDTKTPPSFFLQLFHGGVFKETTSADEDFEQWDFNKAGGRCSFCVTFEVLESKLAGTHEEAHDAWCFFFEIFSLQGGGKWPTQWPGIRWPLLGEFFATHSITSFANIVFGAIKRILSIAITVESAIRVESKDIQWSRDVLHWLHCPFFFGLVCLWNIYGPEPFQILRPRWSKTSHSKAASSNGRPMTNDFWMPIKLRSSQVRKHHRRCGKDWDRLVAKLQFHAVSTPKRAEEINPSSLVRAEETFPSLFHVS